MNNNQEITAYNESQTTAYQPICELLFSEINKQFSQAEKQNMAQTSRLVFGGQPHCRV